MNIKELFQEKIIDILSFLIAENRWQEHSGLGPSIQCHTKKWPSAFVKVEMTDYFDHWVTKDLLNNLESRQYQFNIYLNNSKSHVRYQIHVSYHNFFIVQRYNHLKFRNYREKSESRQISWTPLVKTAYRLLQRLESDLIKEKLLEC